MYLELIVSVRFSVRVFLFQFAEVLSQAIDLHLCLWIAEILHQGVMNKPILTLCEAERNNSGKSVT